MLVLVQEVRELFSSTPSYADILSVFVVNQKVCEFKFLHRIRV